MADQAETPQDIVAALRKHVEQCNKFDNGHAVVVFTKSVIEGLADAVEHTLAAMQRRLDRAQSDLTTVTSTLTTASKELEAAREHIAFLNSVIQPVLSCSVSVECVLKHQCTSACSQFVRAVAEAKKRFNDGGKKDA